MNHLEALTLSDSPLPRVKVNALVIFSILNSFVRRSARDSRVIGTLLGEEKDGVVTVTDCFALLHKERMGELYVEINHEYHKSMAAFHRRNNKNERIVGWYATTTLNGEFLVDNSSLIHNFYSNECANPIHLVVDTTLLRDSVSVRGFMGSTMTVADEPLANTFQEVQVNLDLSDSEVTCLNHMINGQSEGSEWSNSEVIATIPPEKEQIPASLNEMVATIDEILQYVDEIVEGKRQPTREIGVAISEALTLFSSYSNSDPAAMSDAQNKSQDLLLVTFLSSLTQAQSLISSKLNSIL